MVAGIVATDAECFTAEPKLSSFINAPKIEVAVASSSQCKWLAVIVSGEQMRYKILHRIFTVKINFNNFTCKSVSCA